MLYGLGCLIRERLCIQFYVWNIWPPRFPFWTVWLHLVIIFISLKESAEQWPLWRRHLIRPPLPPHRPPSSSGGEGSGEWEEGKGTSGFSLSNAPVREGTRAPESLWSSHTWETLKGSAPLLQCTPISDPHVGPRCLLVEVLFFVSL